ncbi:hypothetical protein OROMI_007282 [Orobanche minor]
MDHYKILGVQKSASKEEIKQAFRKLAMEFHPRQTLPIPKGLKDSATAKFKQLSEAYETLIDDAIALITISKEMHTGPIKINIKIKIGDMITTTAATAGTVIEIPMLIGIVGLREEAAALL